MKSKCWYVCLCVCEGRSVRSTSVPPRAQHSVLSAWHSHMCMCVCVRLYAAPNKASSTCRLLIRGQSYAARRRHSSWKNGKFNYFTRRSNSQRAMKHLCFGAEDEKVRARPFPHFTCAVAQLECLSAYHLRRCLLSNGKVSAQIMSSALFLASEGQKKRQPVSIQTPLNQARGTHTNTYRCTLQCLSLTLPGGSDCSMEFLVARAFVASHRSNSFHFSTLASSHHLTVQGLLFICHASGLVGGGVSMHGCPCARGVETQRVGECGQTVVVSRQKPGRLRESQGKLVSQETHWKRIHCCEYVCEGGGRDKCALDGRKTLRSPV